MQNPLSYLPLDKMRCFEVFNAAARRPAKGEPLHAIDSEGYKANAAATYAIAIAFRERAQQRAAEFKQPHMTAESGRFDRGLTEFNCHEDDAPLLKSILDGMKSDGLLAGIAEQPFNKSMLYALAKGTVTPH